MLCPQRHFFVYIVNIVQQARFAPPIYKGMEKRNLPLARLKWLKRPAERKKLPASYFLLPKERKFPYRNKDGSVN